MDLVLDYRPAYSINVGLKVSLPASQLKTPSEIAVWSDLLKDHHMEFWHEPSIWSFPVFPSLIDASMERGNEGCMSFVH